MPKQSFGFFMMFVLFLICGAAYPVLTGSVTGYKAFQVRPLPALPA
jgi:K+-transporting ATPase c subunit